jgi:four helix bundle protein
MRLNMSEERWQKLEVWKVSDQLAFDVYKITRDFPRDELYGLTSQLRRAALSVPTNIVEGYSRKGDKELAHFINIALGSFAETKYLLYFSHRLNYIDDKKFVEIKNIYTKLGKLLWKFYEAVRTK